MWVSLDVDRMRLTHKHELNSVVYNLAALELTTVAYTVWSLDGTADMFRNFTDLQLHTLYHAFTDNDCPDYKRRVLLQLIVNLCDAAPVTKAKAAEVELQAAYVETRTECAWRYVYGARRPIKGEPLWLSATLAPDTVKQALAGQITAVTSAVATVNTSGRVAAPTVPQKPVKTADKPVKTGKRGHVKQAIHDKATIMWQAAGSPMDKTVLLSLRKTIMDSLESEGINRLTASSELGNWQKLILNK